MLELCGILYHFYQPLNSHQAALLLTCASPEWYPTCKGAFFANMRN